MHQTRSWIKRPELCYILTLWFWASHLTLLRLSFLFCKMGAITLVLSLSYDYCGNKINSCKFTVLNYTNRKQHSWKTFYIVYSLLILYSSVRFAKDQIINHNLEIIYWNYQCIGPLIQQFHVLEYGIVYKIQNDIYKSNSL